MAFRSPLGQQFKMRMVLAPVGERRPVLTREPIDRVTEVDEMSLSIQRAKSSLSQGYQYFRRAGEDINSFFRALGIGLLEHYCRKTTQLDEFENFRKWLKRQEGITEVKEGKEEEFSTLQHVLTILGQDKRENPGLTMYQLQNLLSYTEFDQVLVVMFRMMVFSSLLINATTLRLSRESFARYQQGWENLPVDDNVIRAAALGFNIAIVVEDCTREYRPKSFSPAMTSENRPLLQFLECKRGFLILYKNKVTLIDGFNEGQFNTENATEQEMRYSTECYTAIS